MSEIENLKIDGGSTYTVGNQDIIANEWEASKTYVKGKSYVIREHRLYVCNVTHTSVEPFDPDNWTEITVGDAIANNTTAIGSLSTLTTTVKSSIVGAVNELDSDKADTASLATVATSGLFNDLLSNPFNNNGLIADLNITVRGAGECKLNVYNGGATNSPSGSAGGWVFTFTNNGSTAYGGQFAISNGGCYYRALVSNTYGTWRTLATA